ncbi:MAG TPA: CVNH domain-containing protein [Stellaceae bacterium]|nr:CVNH domain-containing protein [Stellaceae bacterium]
MRSFVLAAAVAGLAAAGGGPARAQAIPPGSYQRSCTQIHWAGTTLVAECRRADGRMQGTGLPDANRCAGDIGNNNGRLQCTYAGGGQSPGSSPVPRGQPGPSQGYGPGPGPGYGGPGYADRRERCEHLRHEQNELRGRIPYTWGAERDRLEHRLHEIRKDRDRLGCG